MYTLADMCAERRICVSIHFNTLYLLHKTYILYVMLNITGIVRVLLNKFTIDGTCNKFAK